MGRLDGKVALITGGAKGIGAETARLFRREGASVAISYRGSKAEALEQAREFDLMAVQADVTKPAQVRRLVDAVAKRHGGIDILVNNASHSAAGSFGLPIEAVDDAEWERTVAVDVTGTFLVSKYAAPQLRRRKGTIVNFASAASLMGDETVLLYSAAKAGITGFTRCLAKSLAPDVRVNAIAPGSIATEWIEKWKVPRAALQQIVQATPLRRLGFPIEIAQAALFLAGPESAFVTGQTLVVDGGIYMV